MSSTTTPNMNLVIPTTGSQPGPQYANNINGSLSTIDAHNHTPGYGVAIPVSGLSIQTGLPFNNNPALSLQASVYTAQGSLATNQAVYVQGVDLYYNDGNGNVIQLTNNGSISGSAGNISGLVSPAAVTYGSGVFTFQSDSTGPTAGNIDAASIVIRKAVASSPGITLTAPSALSSDYSLTLPAAPPATNRIMTIDPSGNIGALDMAGDQLTTNVTTGKLDFNYEISGGNILNILNTNAGLFLADATNAFGISFGGGRINGLNTAFLDGAQLLFGSSGALNSSAVGLYKDPTAQDALWFQWGTNPGTAYPIVTSQFTGVRNSHILFGRISSSGSTLSGAGFSSTRTGTGQYTISYLSSFSLQPSVVCTAVLNNSTVPCIVSLTGINNGSQFSIQIVTSSGVLADADFNFQVIGSP